MQLNTQHHHNSMLLFTSMLHLPLSYILAVHNILFSMQYARIIANNGQNNSALLVQSSWQQCSILLLFERLIAYCILSQSIFQSILYSTVCSLWHTTTVFQNTAKIMSLFLFQTHFCQMSVSVHTEQQSANLTQHVTFTITLMTSDCPCLLALSYNY